MYNDKIKVDNKIISYDDLLEIFEKMNEKLLYYLKIYKTEVKQNEMLQYDYQKWSFNNISSSLSFNIDFYDNTTIKFDNYNSFIGIFNSRLDDIRSIYVYFNIHYSISNDFGKQNYYNQHINLYIYETKMDIDISLSSEDKKIDDIYTFIKAKILAAPVKYDFVIKNRVKINNTIGLALGFIPSVVITIMLYLIPMIRQIFMESYVLYPIILLILSFFIGGSLANNKLDRLYKSIIPEQKYAGYDADKGTNIYKDDIDKYIETSEILIGRNVNNLKCRKEIMYYYKKYKKYIPYEFGILILLSIIMLLAKS